MKTSVTKRIAIVATVSFAFFGIQNPAIGVTPKAGASCSKLGLTSTSNGKKYTCIKSGKKLVWNKGVSVVKATPTPTPTPTHTHTHTHTRVRVNHRHAHAHTTHTHTHTHE